MAPVIQNLGDRIAAGVQAKGYELLVARTPQNGAGIVSLPQARDRSHRNRAPSPPGKDHRRRARRVGPHLSALLHQSGGDRPPDRRPAVTGWLRRHPLAAFLPLQALLYCWNLALLSPWGDEAVTLLDDARDARRTHAICRAGYSSAALLFAPILLVTHTIRLSTGRFRRGCFRFASRLLGTVALDRLWGSRFEARTRITLLALWTLSPCLLLYARMCRSYTLQALFAIVASALLVRVAEKAGRAEAALLALALLGALYTHYVAGIALIATANLVLVYRRQVADGAGASIALIVIGYLPWICAPGGVAGRLGHEHPQLCADRIARAGSPGQVRLLVDVVRDGRGRSRCRAGAGRLALAAGGVRRLAGRAPLAGSGGAGRGVWASSASSAWRAGSPTRSFRRACFSCCRSSAAGRVRIGSLPLGQTGSRRDAAAVACPASGATSRRPASATSSIPCRSGRSPPGLCSESAAGDSAILVDSTNSDPIALTLCAHPPDAPCCRPTSRRLRPSSTRLLADPRVRTVWFLRNTHDVSPGGLNTDIPEPSCARA